MQSYHQKLGLTRPRRSPANVSIPTAAPPKVAGIPYPGPRMSLLRAKQPHSIRQDEERTKQRRRHRYDACACCARFSMPNVQS